MDPLSQSSLIVAIISFALAASILARNVRNKLYLSFAGMAMGIFGWALMFFLERIWGGGTFYRWHLLFNVWLAPLGLGLIRVLVRIHDRFSRWLLDGSVALALALSVGLGFHYDSNPWVSNLVIYAPAVILVQILELMWIDRGLRRGLQRLPKAPTVGFARKNLIYFGGLLVLLTSVMDHVPWVGETVPVFGNLALTTYLFFVSRAVTQQRLLNFGAVFSRFLVLLAVALTLTAVYSVLFAWIEKRPALFFLNSFIVSFLLLTLIDPIRSFVAYLTQRLLTQKHRRLQEIVREAERRLAGILDPGQILQAILMTAEQTLQPKWAAVFVLVAEGTRFRRVRVYEGEGAMAAEAEPVREILATHPLIQHCERLRRKGDLPILLDQILENESDRSASRVQRENIAGLIQGLKALSANLLVPLFDSERILGFVAFRVDGPPEPWGGNWGLLSVLYPYFEQAGQSLKSMGLFARQREKERLAALGEMAAGLAHEIRNPLGAIKGAAQVLETGVVGPTQQNEKFVQVIVEEVDRLNRVVSQFLDYSKPPATDLTPVDASELARKTVDLIRPGLPSGVRIEFVPASKSVRVMGSSGQLHQVLINLLQNSVKALESRQESGLIRVSIEAEGHAQTEVAIVVEDNGKGIKRENMEKLFIPFFTTSPSGTGLGLSISQKIIEAHRGRIEVASEEGRFTRFSVVLPSLEA